MGKHSAHVRKRRSSNRDLRAMRALANNDQLYSVNLKHKGGKVPGIGKDAGSEVTNSEPLARATERANCRTCEEVQDAVNEEVMKQHWEPAHVQFEQHMKEEDEVRVSWIRGNMKKGG